MPSTSGPSQKVGIMSSEEHHVELKADAGASMTYPMEAVKIECGDFIVIDNRPCEVIRYARSKALCRQPPQSRYWRVRCWFFVRDLFTGKTQDIFVPSTHICDVARVKRTFYQLINISADGFVSLLTKDGGTKDDVRLPTDDGLLTLIKDGFAVGKKLILSVMSALGEEQIVKVKKIDSEVCGRKRSRLECDDVSAMGEKQICAVKEIGAK